MDCGKDMNDSCPNRAAALENGLRAVGSGVVKVFSRAETIGKADTSGFLPALQGRFKQGFTTGACVTFVVFNPDMSSIVAEASRTEFQGDKKAIGTFKKKVQDARKVLKSSALTTGF